MFLLLGIGNTDYSNIIHEGTYKVYKENVTHNWEDGNHKMHRDTIRTKTSGSFEVEFKTWAAFETFLKALNAVKTGNEYALSVYSLNTNEGVTGSFFVTLPPELRQKNDLTFTPGVFTIQIEES